MMAYIYYVGNAEQDEPPGIFYQFNGLYYLAGLVVSQTWMH